MLTRDRSVNPAKKERKKNRQPKGRDATDEKKEPPTLSMARAEKKIKKRGENLFNGESVRLRLRGGGEKTSPGRGGNLVKGRGGLVAS